MSPREEILGRVREALRVPAPRPHAAGPQPPHPGHATPQDWLPPVGESLEARIALFASNAAALKAVFHEVAGPEQAALLLAGLAGSEGWKRVAVHAGEPESFAAGLPGVAVLRVERGYKLEDLEACDAGLTTCDALVAQTGSVLVNSRTCGGRALSVLPPHHVVLARRSQMAPDLGAALALARERFGDRYPSMLSLITGPSRTGDIERILVLGAHGPKKLTIFLLP